MADITWLPMDPTAEALSAEINPTVLGLPISRMWNPSPSLHHRVSPYDVPEKLAIGILGNEKTAAKFSPPPFAVVIEGAGEAAFVAIFAPAGWHRWNEASFEATEDWLRVAVDLEGHTDPNEAANHVKVAVIRGQPNEPRQALLARGLAALYPDAAQRPAEAPAWWDRPIYCGWGDQVATAFHLEGPGPEPRALAYCTQGLYERWVRRLDEADLPFGTIIIDAGWSPAGWWEPNTERWPDLRAFIDRQHDKGRRVLLWLATWLWDGLPDDWCVFADGVKLTSDPTHPGYREYIREKVHALISPDGYDADGFKIDQLAYSPSERRPRGGPRFGRTDFHPAPDRRIELHGDNWGTELLHQLQKDIHDAAKAAKPDCLITSSTVHPYFHDTFDMTRLHDMGVVAEDIFEAMGARADLAKAALPWKPIDTDDWIHSDYEMWMRYTKGARRLGVPCIFYAERFMADWEHEPATKEIPLADLRSIGEAWRASG